MGLISGGRLVARMLKQEGVPHIFSLCGGSILPIYEGCIAEGIEIIDVRHEQSAAFAALAWAKVTGAPGVVVATAGPGVTNLTTAVASAFRDSVPMVAIGGKTNFSQFDTGAPQDLEQVALLSPITKWARSALQTERIPEYLSTAFRQAVGPAGGPVFLEIPEDILKVKVEETEVELPVDSRAVLRPQGAPQLIVEAVALLSRAEKPVAVAGGGVWWSQSYRELRRFLEMGDIPVFLVGMGRGAVPYGHRLYYNYARRFALSQADVITVIGTPIDFRLGYGRPPLFNSGVKVIQLDFEPGSIGLNRGVDVGIYGDIKAVLGQLVTGMEKAGAVSRSQWVDPVRRYEEEQERAQAPLLDSDDVPIHPLRLLREVRDFLDEDATIIGDGGDFVSFAARVMRVYHPGHWLDPGTFGSLGFGAGAAIAAKLARPDKQVLILHGDGSFGFSAMEFDTMVRKKLPVVSVIGNDAKWGQVKAYFHVTGKTPGGVDLSPDARYDKLVTALGGYGELVEKPEEIRPALERAFASGLPACLNVRLSPDVYYGERSYKAADK